MVRDESSEEEEDDEKEDEDDTKDDDEDEESDVSAVSETKISMATKDTVNATTAGEPKPGMSASAKVPSSSMTEIETLLTGAGVLSNDSSDVSMTTALTGSAAMMDSSSQSERGELTGAAMESDSSDASAGTLLTGATSLGDQDSESLLDDTMLTGASGISDDSVESSAQDVTGKTRAAEMKERGRLRDDTNDVTMATELTGGAALSDMSDTSLTTLLTGATGLNEDSDLSLETELTGAAGFGDSDSYTELTGAAGFGDSDSYTELTGATGFGDSDSYTELTGAAGFGDSDSYTELTGATGFGDSDSYTELTGATGFGDSDSYTELTGATGFGDSDSYTELTGATGFGDSDSYTELTGATGLSDESLTTLLTGATGLSDTSELSLDTELTGATGLSDSDDLSLVLTGATGLSDADDDDDLLLQGGELSDVSDVTLTTGDVSATSTATEATSDVSMATTTSMRTDTSGLSGAADSKGAVSVVEPEHKASNSRLTREERRARRRARRRAASQTSREERHKLKLPRKTSRRRRKRSKKRSRSKRRSRSRSRSGARKRSRSRRRSKEDKSESMTTRSESRSTKEVRKVNPRSGNVIGKGAMHKPLQLTLRPSPLNLVTKDTEPDTATSNQKEGESVTSASGITMTTTAGTGSDLEPVTINTNASNTNNARLRRGQSSRLSSRSLRKDKEHGTTAVSMTTSSEVNNMKYLKVKRSKSEERCEVTTNDLQPGDIRAASGKHIRRMRTNSRGSRVDHYAEEYERSRMKSISTSRQSSRSNTEVKSPEMRTRRSSNLRRSISSRGQSDASGNQKNNGDLELEEENPSGHPRCESRRSAQSGQKRRSASRRSVDTRKTPDDMSDEGRRSYSRRSINPESADLGHGGSTPREVKRSELRVSRSDSRRRHDGYRAVHRSRGSDQLIQESDNQRSSSRKSHSSKSSDARKKNRERWETEKAQRTRSPSGRIKSNSGITYEARNPKPEEKERQGCFRSEHVSTRCVASEMKNLSRLPVSELGAPGVAKLREALQREIDKRSKSGASSRIRMLSKAFLVKHPSSQQGINLRRFEGIRPGSEVVSRSYANGADSGSPRKSSEITRSAIRATYGAVSSDYKKLGYSAAGSQMESDFGASGPVDFQSSKFTGQVQNLKKFFEKQINYRKPKPEARRETTTATSGETGNNMAPSASDRRGTSGVEDRASVHHVGHVTRRMDCF